MLALRDDHNLTNRYLFLQTRPRGVLQVAKSTKSAQLTGKIKSQQGAWFEVSINLNQRPVHHRSAPTSHRVEVCSGSTLTALALRSRRSLCWTDTAHRVVLDGAVENPDRSSGSEADVGAAAKPVSVRWSRRNIGRPKESAFRIEGGFQPTTSQNKTRVQMSFIIT